jgi:kynurenine formamidase
MAGLIDLSHEIEHGMVTYRGLPSPTVSDWLSREASTTRYAPGTTFQIGKIELLANTGTYIDAPFHRYEDGKDVAGYALDAVADLAGVVVRANGGSKRPIDASRFKGQDLRGKAVLVHTGWDAHWRTDTYSGGQHPFVTKEAAEHLVKAGATLVGIDSLNIDDDKDGSRPAHTILLGAGIAIVEHMTNLAALPDSGFRFYAVPPRVKGMGSFPVRAFARLERQPPLSSRAHAPRGSARGLRAPCDRNRACRACLGACGRTGSGTVRCR